MYIYKYTYARFLGKVKTMSCCYKSFRRLWIEFDDLGKTKMYGIRMKDVNKRSDYRSGDALCIRDVLSKSNRVDCRF